MKLPRELPPRLDAWAAVLIGILIALSVVILLATPGPWHRVMGPAAPVKLSSPPPDDVAVLVRAGRDGSCTGALWLHLDHTQRLLTVTVVSPLTVGVVRGGGSAPLWRAADDAGPQAAADALGAALGVEMDAWIALERPALRAAVPTMFPVSESRAAGQLFRRASGAWFVNAHPERRWPVQYAVLALALPTLPYDQLKVVPFTNYVLGFGFVQSDLDLQGATSLATTLSALDPSRVYVRAAGAVLETCGGVREWRIDAASSAALRAALTFGQPPPASPPAVSQRSRHARVLVVVPGGGEGSRVYVAEVRRRLRRSAGGPVRVRSLTAGTPGTLEERVMSEVEGWDPLVVLFAPALDPGDPSAVDEASALRRVGERLRLAGRQGVISAPLPAGDGSDAAALAAVRASGLAVSPLAGLVPATAGAAEFGVSVRARAAARANAETLVRAAWPGVLAPRLASTRLGFTLAAARHVVVAVLGPERRVEVAVARLRGWGYQAAVSTAESWVGGLAGRAVYYHEGRRRAALALAGDLGLRKGVVMIDDSAPAEVTLTLE